MPSMLKPTVLMVKFRKGQSASQQVQPSLSPADVGTTSQLEQQQQQQ